MDVCQILTLRHISIGEGLNFVFVLVSSAINLGILKRVPIFLVNKRFYIEDGVHKFDI